LLGDGSRTHRLIRAGLAWRCQRGVRLLKEALSRHRLRLQYRLNLPLAPLVDLLLIISDLHRRIHTAALSRGNFLYQMVCLRISHFVIKSFQVLRVHIQRLGLALNHVPRLINEQFIQKGIAFRLILRLYDLLQLLLTSRLDVLSLAPELFVRDHLLDQAPRLGTFLKLQENFLPHLE